ncbi:type II toxin-antitoxin system PemK/MazF family toxin [Enterococcus gallinarum]|uniref:type II toxin-antitoxin system PemK/MazF family toxin n=1 Tax=Enterococcus gallinarum TaxID=1353 RepID=UPI002952C06F|nr:type II toxin-antitoxin system PemK/MazF family toxin [Enterococcus gallinarum]MDV7786034.1 type II toxin-antitoxin system PemK/MazF family toxin [Enterococcus gallinarum]
MSNNNNNNNGKINTSSKKFKIVANSNSPKGKFLANWLLTKSYHLEREINPRPVQFYDTYKRGTVVMVDFGVNIGNEMSNRHFGIVINKTDNKKNGIITVLPLSSKFSPHYLKLNDELFTIIVDDIGEKLRSLMSELNEVEAVLKKSNLNDKKSIAEADTPKIETVREYLLEKLNAAADKRQKLEDILKVYMKYNKDTFVCTKNIQTLSKLRVFKINEYDPSGSMRISKSTMERIDNEIVSVLTNIKISN